MDEGGGESGCICDRARVVTSGISSVDVASVVAISVVVGSVGNSSTVMQ